MIRSEAFRPVITKGFRKADRMPGVDRGTAAQSHDSDQRQPRRQRQGCRQQRRRASDVQALTGSQPCEPASVGPYSPPLPARTRSIPLPLSAFAAFPFIALVVPRSTPRTFARLIARRPAALNGHATRSFARFSCCSRSRRAGSRGVPDCDVLTPRPIRLFRIGWCASSPRRPKRRRHEDSEARARLRHFDCMCP